MRRADRAFAVDRTPTLYRIVKSDPPTERDFWSHKRSGLRYHPSREHVANGVSTFDREQKARRTARRFPNTGTLIAELHIPDWADVTVAQTMGRHYYAIWGDPKLLVTFVVRVAPV